MTTIEAVTKAIKDQPRSFNSIRRRTGLKLSDREFLDMIRENQERFLFARFVRKDAAGNRVRPGWPGIRLRDH